MNAVDAFCAAIIAESSKNGRSRKVFMGGHNGAWFKI
jgi:hypothetical protein